MSITWIYRDEAYYPVFSRGFNLAPSYDETDLRLWFNTFIGCVRNVFDDEGFESVGATRSAWRCAR